MEAKGQTKAAKHQGGQLGIIVFYLDTNPRKQKWFKVKAVIVVKEWSGSSNLSLAEDLSLCLKKLLMCITNGLTPHVGPAYTALWSPVLQTLTYCVYVLTPLGTIFMRNEVLKATRERKTFCSAPWKCPSSIFYCLCADPLLMGRRWWHLLSPLLFSW